MEDDVDLGRGQKRCGGFFFSLAGDLCLRFSRGNGLLGGAVFPSLGTVLYGSLFSVIFKVPPPYAFLKNCKVRTAV